RVENLFYVNSKRYLFRGNLEVRDFKGLIASWISTKKNRALMTRDVRRQPNKERQQRSSVGEPSGSYVRSPALQSAEERRGSVAQGTKSRGSKTSKSYVRFASEEKLMSPGLSRKRLPRLNTSRAMPDQRSGLT